MPYIYYIALPHKYRIVCRTKLKLNTQSPLSILPLFGSFVDVSTPDIKNRTEQRATEDDIGITKILPILPTDVGSVVTQTRSSHETILQRMI